MVFTIFFNTINLYLMFYFFILASILLTQHSEIKNVANKGKEIGDDDYIEDWNLHLIGGFFAYLVIYFGMNFYHQTFFGNSLG